MPKAPYTWKDAKRMIRLTDAEVYKAQRLGIDPDNLVRNKPNPKEGWKDSPALRIHRLYDIKFPPQNKND